MKPRRWTRWLTYFALAVLLLIGLLLARALYAFRDRNPGYSVNLAISDVPARAQPRPLRVGLARHTINPDLSDPKRPVWVAGFGQNRAATALHDDLWAIAAVLDDGHTRLGIAVLDAIGMFHDDVVAIRRALPPELKLDYVIVCTTHNHSTPDLMGMWGPSPFRSGVDPAYRQQVLQTTARCLTEAATGLQPARMALFEIPMFTDGLVADTRPPIVFDPDIRVMLFLNATNDTVLGSIVGWANHPETPWSNNREITADFCGYLRDALAEGVILDGKRVLEGVGGVHLYINGAIGGLMTTHPATVVRDPFSGQELKEPSHAKARAVGWHLAARIRPHLGEAPARAVAHAPIAIQARTVEVPLDNPRFLAASLLGLFDRGHSRWMRLRTEVAVITVGDASIACVPGEIYPEIINGGVERPAGADFDIEPIEVPPLRQLMPGRVKFVFGLANDELGYLIPKSQWDEKPPHPYGASRSPYGEINSVGPDAAATLHAALAQLCREITGAQTTAVSSR
ncbi:MAG: DUF2070 family protein [Verrucomicrobiae bacterium]|nr:DUF2070 family protein [Verrucomicrobiae bacterium]